MTQKYRLIGVDEERTFMGRQLEQVITELDGTLWRTLRYADSKGNLDDSGIPFPGQTLEDAEDRLSPTCYDIYWEKIEGYQFS